MFCNMLKGRVQPVKEDFVCQVLVTSCMDQCLEIIRRYYRYSSSNWTSVFNVKVIVNEESRGLGDALRDLDGRSLISTDFLLLYGDLVANLSLKTILEKHK